MSSATEFLNELHTDLGDRTFVTPEDELDAVLAIAAGLVKLKPFLRQRLFDLKVQFGTPTARVLFTAARKLATEAHVRDALDAVLNDPVQWNDVPSESAIEQAVELIKNSNREDVGALKALLGESLSRPLLDLLVRRVVPGGTADKACDVVHERFAADAQIATEWAQAVLCNLLLNMKQDAEPEPGEVGMKSQLGETLTGDQAEDLFRRSGVEAASAAEEAQRLRRWFGQAIPMAHVTGVATRLLAEQGDDARVAITKEVISAMALMFAAMPQPVINVSSPGKSVRTVERDDNGLIKSVTEQAE